MGAAADCVKAIHPKRVYVYRYDQTFASSGNAGADVAVTLRSFK